MTLPDRIAGNTGHVADHNIIHGMLRYGYFSISDYGAVPDDSGVAAANVTAIQAAITAARAVGGTVYIPPRIFYIQSTTGTIFDLDDGGVTIKGDGRASCLKIKDNDGDYSTIFGSTGTPVDISFADFRVDQNPTGNTTCDINSAGGESTKQWVIHLWEMTNVTVDRVHFDPCTGVNTVSLGGTTAAVTHATVRDCYFRFVKGATTETAGGFTYYDNSAVYLECSEQVVVGNTWHTTLADDAFACIEAHGGRVTITGNVCIGYETLVNAVTKAFNPSPPPTYATTDPNTIVITGNSITEAKKGIILWPVTGSTYEDIIVSDNTIHLNILDRTTGTARHNNYWYTGIGINWGTGGDLEGTMRSIVISDNIIDAQVDTSTDYGFDESVGGAINLQHYSSLDGVTVTGNLIRNYPKFGIVVWARNPGSGTTHGFRNIKIAHNLTIDCGLNTVGTAYYRTHIGYLTGGPTMRGVYITDNTMVDTGTGALKGVAAITGAIGSGQGSNVHMERNIALGYFATLPDDVSGVHSSVALKHDRIRVGNSVTATESIGKAVSRKIEVFDPTGTSLGFVPVYSSIT